MHSFVPVCKLVVCIYFGVFETENQKKSSWFLYNGNLVSDDSQYVPYIQRNILQLSYPAGKIGWMDVTLTSVSDVRFTLVFG